MGNRGVRRVRGTVGCGEFRENEERGNRHVMLEAMGDGCMDAKRKYPRRMR